MISPLFLGLMGSFGHCVGMCGPVSALLARHPSVSGVKGGWVLVHAGRIAVYAVMGAAAGAFGQAIGLTLPSLVQVQGALALAAANVAIYFALSLIGWAPSPERLFSGLIAHWGVLMRIAIKGRQGNPTNPNRFTPFGLGMLWGMLPCGLVLAAAFTAALSGSALMGAGTMLAFGTGTLPALLGVRWLAGLRWLASWPRYAAAIVVAAFGIQFALRGLAAWGLVGHTMVMGVMLW